MFDPSGFWIDLLVLFLVNCDDIPAVVKQDAASAGRALVYGGDIFWHHFLQ
jgi:hypothetical protein